MAEQDGTAPGDGLISFFARHRNAANLLMAILVVLGFYAASRLNRQIMPDFGIDIISVAIVWPGASAEDVEANIVEAIEPEVRYLDGVDKVNSFAFEGRAQIVIEFNTGTDMAKAFSDVDAAVSRITTLPEDIERPVISQFEHYDLVSRIVLSGPFSELALKTAAKRMRRDLLARGIDKVELSGVRSEEIIVDVEPEATRRLGLKLADITERIRASSLDLPSGTLDGLVERQIRSIGLATTARSVGNIEVRSRKSGEKIRLTDIGTVRDAFKDDEASGFSRGHHAVQLTIKRARSADAIDTAEQVERYLGEVVPSLPPSLSVTHYDIQARLISDRIALLIKNGVSGLILVLGVLFLFLNGRLALWVAAGIPVALLAALAVMLVTGQSINMVSLMALIMTLGIIVDDAIVVSEHAATRRAQGLSAPAAAISGARRMLAPVLASSLTTVATFLPIFMISNIMGQIIAALPLVVISVLLASLVECFLILPGHLRGALEAPLDNTAHTGLITRVRRRFNQRFDHFRQHRFRRWVAASFDARYTTLAAATGVLIVGGGLLAGGHVGFHFFPQPEAEFLYVNVVLAPGTPRERSADMLREAERALTATERALTGGRGGLVKMTYGTIGRAQNQNSYGTIKGANLAGMVVALTPGDQREVRNTTLIAAWKKQIHPLPGVESLTISERMGGPPGREIDIGLSGADIKTLKKAALALRTLLERFPGVHDVDDDLPYGKEELILELTPRGRALGFSTRSVGRQVRNAFEGAIAKRFARGDEEVLVRVRFPERLAGMAMLRTLYLRSPQGLDVPLSEIVKIRESAGFSRIRRENGERIVSVQADIDESVTSTGKVLAALPGAGLDKIARDFGVHASFAGKAEEQARSFSEVGAGAIIGLIGIYIILVGVFGSYSRPLIVMAIIPFGIIGAIFGHLVMDYDMTFMSLIGLLGLAGILVNDSIILVSAIEEHRRTGKALREAIIAGAQDRLRAVLLTSLTTIGGLLPLMFETSMQASFLVPIAITLVFGIAAATLIVLFVVPALMGGLEDALNRLRRAHAAAHAPRVSTQQKTT